MADGYGIIEKVERAGQLDVVFADVLGTGKIPSNRQGVRRLAGRVGLQRAGRAGDRGPGRRVSGRAASVKIDCMEQATPAERRYTVAEYLAIDDAAEGRYEYRDGDIIAMSRGDVRARADLRRT